MLCMRAHNPSSSAFNEVEGQVPPGDRRSRTRAARGKGEHLIEAGEMLVLKPAEPRLGSHSLECTCAPAIKRVAHWDA
jgi:hypothetical protein